MTREPVLVIHGVANTDELEFNDRVAKLSKRLDDLWELVPVFWNRKGSDPRGIDAAISPFTLGSGVRESGNLPSASPKSPGFELLNAAANHVPETSARAVRGADARADVVADAAAAGLGAVPGPVVREQESQQAAAVRAAIQEEWGNLTYLPNVNDREVLESVGLLVSEAVAQSGDHEVATRAGFDPVGFVRAVLHGADRVAGAITGVVGEGLLWTVRSMLLPNFAKGIGDVLVYESHRAEIATVVREKLEQYGGLGTKERPAKVIGHSLGGIIAFDLAVDPQPVHWSALVTFGSQSPILHVLDPRSDSSLAKYEPDPHRPVHLPITIRKWTNIFEPWDPLAFYAGRVFDNQNRQRIVDIEIPHLDSAGLWTHSAYWTDDVAIRSIRRALTDAGEPG